MSLNTSQIHLLEPKMLLVFSAKSLHGKVPTKVKLPVQKHIRENIRPLYGIVDDASFNAEEKRRLISLKDVRIIYSLY